MLEIRNLYKSFGEKKVLEKFNLTIYENEIYGLIGQNGSGKSTLMNIIGNIIKPDSGNIYFRGIPFHEKRKQFKNNIAVIPQENSLFLKLSIVDNLIYWGGIAGIKKKEIRERGNFYLKLYGLEHRKNELIENLSGGMKRYISVIAALIQKPKILLCDEPTVGIDPSQRQNLLDLIIQMKNQGCSVIFSTHYLEEAEKICDRIGIINDGNVQIEGKCDEIKAKYGQGEKIVITTSGKPDNLFKQNPRVQIEDNQVTFLCNDTKKELLPFINQVQLRGLKIVKLEIKPSSLECIFLNQMDNNKAFIK